MKAIAGLICVTIIVSSGFFVGPNLIGKTAEKKGTAFEIELRAAHLNSQCLEAQAWIRRGDDATTARNVLERCKLARWNDPTAHEE